MTEQQNHEKMANLLKRVRVKAQVSQQTAAKKIYLTPQGNVSSIERGRLFPTLENVTSVYFSMASRMSLSDFLLPSWVEVLYTKNPYYKAFKDAEELRDWIIQYATKFPFYRIEKDELLKFKVNPTSYQIPKTAHYMSPFNLKEDDVMTNRILSKKEQIDWKSEIQDSFDIDEFVLYLDNSIRNLNGLVNYIQEHRTQSEPLNVSIKEELNKWIDQELRYAEYDKLIQLKDYWEKHLK
ncbi:helix-turn-helix domain-containing protein (plasmid) [Ureibacillus chungkukjangi]|uniref:helix-turn-helix transcriptional regulator n=1 Tax=Ureibacillus chungkukjangi TaxID=1202712 RepID=UPI000D3A1276|nr:helix-turn-helix transcriptional regulator [Ureibacillus chungkukjangi]